MCWKHLATTKHPNSNDSILVTELLDCNLSTYIVGYETSLTNECEISIAKDLASGLAYIHSREIMHRDLCGVNVLIKLQYPNPIAKIADFGTSKSLDPSKSNTTIIHRTGYLPPEALHEGIEDYDLSLDVFSCGVIMMQMVLRKENVRSRKERNDLREEINQGEHPLRTNILRCLEENKDDRPSADDLCHSLERQMSGQYEDSRYDHRYEHNRSAVQASLEDVTLTMDHVQGTLLPVLKKVNEKWYIVGLALDVEEAVLEEIQDAYFPDDKRCMLQMLTTRINQGGLTRSVLCDALKNTIVGEDDIALEIKDIQL